MTETMLHTTIESPVGDLLFSPNGYLLCACDNGAVYILRLPS